MRSIAINGIISERKSYRTSEGKLLPDLRNIMPAGTMKKNRRSKKQQQIPWTNRVQKYRKPREDSGRKKKHSWASVVIDHRGQGLKAHDAKDEMGATVENKSTQEELQ